MFAFPNHVLILTLTTQSKQTKHNFSRHSKLEIFHDSHSTYMSFWKLPQTTNVVINVFINVSFYSKDLHNPKYLIHNPT